MRVPTKCHKCGYAWMYQGTSTYRTPCPRCHITVYFSGATRATKAEIANQIIGECKAALADLEAMWSEIEPRKKDEVSNA